MGLPRTLTIAAIALMAFRPLTATAATEINSCGQEYAGSGFLAADLDCTGFPSDAIVLNGGSLDLRGFTLTGGDASAVYCTKGCKVVSEPPGGQIVGASYFGISGDDFGLVPGTAPVQVTNVVISGNSLGQIKAIGNVTVIDSVIADSAPNIAIEGIVVKVINSSITNSGIAIVPEGARVIDSQITNCTDRCIINNFNSVLVRGSTISGAGTRGISASTRVRVINSTISGSGGDGIGVSVFSRVQVIDSDIVGNGGNGIFAGDKVLVKGSNISGNALDGVHNTGPVRMVDSTVTSNGRSGIDTEASMFSTCGPVRLINSSVTGNGTDGAACGVTETCADLATCQEPAILSQGSTCETSYNTNSGFPGTNWGICTLD